MNNNMLTMEDQERLRQQQMQAEALRQQQAQQAQQSSGGSGGGSGGGGMMGAAMSNPWLALGTAIVANESVQSADGNRQEQTGDYVKELLSGEVLERDADKYLSDIPGAEFHAEMGNPEGIAKNLKKGLMPWEWF